MEGSLLGTEKAKVLEPGKQAPFFRVDLDFLKLKHIRHTILYECQVYNIVILNLYTI